MPVDKGISEKCHAGARPAFAPAISTIVKGMDRRFLAVIGDNGAYPM
jgi:hypothetical protein